MTVIYSKTIVLVNGVNGTIAQQNVGKALRHAPTSLRRPQQGMVDSAQSKVERRRLLHAISNDARRLTAATSHLMEHVSHTTQELSQRLALVRLVSDWMLPCASR